MEGGLWNLEKHEIEPHGYDVGEWREPQNCWGNLANAWFGIFTRLATFHTSVCKKLPSHEDETPEKMERD